MKPLFTFETPKRQKSVDEVADKILESVLPKFKSTNYKAELHDAPEIGSGVLIYLTSKSIKRSLLIVPWIRPYRAGETTVKALSDYPRLNVHKGCIHLSEEKKLIVMKQLVKKYQLYFLVILQKPNDRDLYWLERYENIPFNYWKLTYRLKKDKLDRIHFPGYEEYDFQNFEELKKKISKIFKDED
jgi:hypothetical protein